MQEPDPEYLVALGDPGFKLNDNAGNIAAGERLGLRTLYNTISSRDEWDEFEWLYRYAMEQHRHEHGLTDEQEQRLEAAREFQAAPQLWGRSTMGFALYLFRVPS